jgi:hypothetical protein
VRSIAHRVARRLGLRKPVIVVSGLPRSGTSMAMTMLGAGGVPLLTDGQRTADVSNPKGYFEFEPVKELHKQGDTAWLREARGKAVKIVSFLLTWLPESHSYKVVFMQRDLHEVIASETAMLLERGEAPDAGREAHTRAIYEQHLDKVHRFLANRRCFELLIVKYGDVLHHPAREARRIGAFVGRPLDVDAMAAVADPALYRNRRDRLALEP